MRVWFDNKCIIGGGEGGQKRLHVLAAEGGGGGQKKLSFISEGGTKSSERSISPFASTPLPINNEHSLRGGSS